MPRRPPPSSSSRWRTSTLATACGLGFVALAYPVAGSIALALSYLAVGLVFTGLIAAAAQIASSGRAALGLSSAALVVAFTLRAIGDIGDNFLRLLSPIGWAQDVRAFAGERWWPLGLCSLAAVGFVITAFWLATQRDLGAGLLPTRPGPGRAAPWMTRPLGLAVRLQRGIVIGWTIGMYVTGVVYGSIGEDIEDLIEENPVYEDLFARTGVDLTDAFFATSLLMLAMIASGFAIATSLRLRTEETAGRAEPILAAPVSRWRWAGSHLLMTLGGTVILIVAGGLGIGTSFAIVSGDAGQVVRMAGASLVTVPPVLVLVGITVALFGLAPRATMLAWVPLVVVVITGIFAELLRLPQWARSISPFEHIPAMPAEGLRIAPVALLLALAAGLVLVGLRGLEARDIGRDVIVQTESHRRRRSGGRRALLRPPAASPLGSHRNGRLRRSLDRYGVAPVNRRCPGLVAA